MAAVLKVWSHTKLALYSKIAHFCHFSRFARQCTSCPVLEMGSEVAFKFDPDPNGRNGVALWQVDFECILMRNVDVQSIGRKSSRHSSKAYDHYDLKKIGTEQTKKILSNYFGQLALM